MKISELAHKIRARLTGDDSASVNGLASLAQAGPQDITFLSDLRYASQVQSTRAGAVIVPDDFTSEVNTTLLFVDNVEDALEQVLFLFAPEPDLPSRAVHASACIASDAEIANDVSIGAGVVIGQQSILGSGTIVSPGCIIEQGVTIGKNCFLGPNVVINQGCILGHNVRVHGNSTIGTDGFGYRLVDGKHRKIPHIGIVVIEDDVEIGANSCVDRAKFGKTVIGRGTKIDNLVQIAHNVKIGENSIIVAQTGIAGSSELGKYVVLGGQCGVSDHVRIGDGAMAAAQSGIGSDVDAGVKVMGSPFRPFRAFFREWAMLQKLPEIAKQLKQIQRQLKSANPKDNS